MRFISKVIFLFYVCAISVSCNSGKPDATYIEECYFSADSLLRSGKETDAFREFIYITKMDTDSSTIFYKAKAFISVAGLYESNYNNIKAAEYLEEACALLDSSECYDSVRFESYLELADLYGKLTEYDNAENVFDMMSDYIRRVDSSLLTIEHLAILSYSFAATGNTLKADLYMKKAESLMTDPISEISVLYWKYKRNLLEYDLVSALDNYTRMSAIQNRMVGKAMNESLQSTLSVYLDSVADLAILRLDLLRKNMFLLIMLFIIALLLTVFLVVRMVRKHRVYEEKQKDNIRELVISIDKLKADLSVTYFDSSIFSMFNEMASIYYDNKDYKPDFLKCKIDALLDAITRDDSFHLEIENNLDRTNDRIMEKFRSSFPDLKAEDCLFAVYVFAGLSNKAISLLTDRNIDAVYRRKYRLKNKISDSDSPYKDLFLSSIKDSKHKKYIYG